MDQIEKCSCGEISKMSETQKGVKSDFRTI